MQNPQKYPTKGKRGNPMHDELIKNLRNCSEINSLSRYKRDLMKQAADTIEELQKDLERSKDFEAFWQHEAEEALKRFQVTISNKPRWIPVTERLPEYDQKVLVFSVYTMYVYKFCVPDERCGAIGNHWQDDYGVAQTIEEGQFWMPLPQPPKDGES